MNSQVISKCQDPATPRWGWLSFGGLELPVVFEDIDELHPLPLTADASLTSTAVYEIAVPRPSPTPSTRSERLRSMVRDLAASRHVP